MKNAIILHGWANKEEFYAKGFHGPGNGHWLPWLQAELLKKDIYAEKPVMPEAHTPQYELWKLAIERSDHFGPDTALVGHSCGGGFWIRYLSENPGLKVGKVVLVAPWLDPNNELQNGFFQDFIIDPRLVERTDGITIFSSTNDHESIKQSINIMTDAIDGVKIQEFKDYGHFLFEDMKTTEFPELLAEVLA